MTDADVLACRKELNDTVLPRHLGHFERLLEQSTTGWLAGGDTPTIIDFIMMPRLEWLVEPGTHEGISTALLERFPRLQALIQKVKQLPEVVRYYNRGSEQKGH